MKFAFIVPEKHLELAAVSNFHIVLTSYYLRSRLYQKFYKQMRARGDFILLDNSFHEYGRTGSDSWSVLLAVANDLEPNVVVIPETPYPDEDLILENLDWIRFIRREEYVPWEFMCVLRGMWFSELADELEFLRLNDGDRLIKWIGLHKDMERFAVGNVGGRKAITLGLEDLLEGYKIHMMGIYKDPIAEVETFKDLPNVFSCDSSKPWRICSRGRLLNEVQSLPSGFDFLGNASKPQVRFAERQFRAFLSNIPK